MTIQEPAPEALLLDIGNVVIEIDFGRTFDRWGQHAKVDPARLRARYSADEPYQRHERGEIPATAYFQSLRRSLGIDISDAEFLDGWNAIFVGEVPGMRTVLARAARRFPLYAFSNTNVVHHAHWAATYGEFLEPFAGIFASSEIGLRKPEPEAFQAVAQSIGSTLERILFFDDTLENVAGAQRIGMPAVHVTDAGDVSRALERYLG